MARDAVFGDDYDEQPLNPKIRRDCYLQLEEKCMSAIRLLLLSTLCGFLAVAVNAQPASPHPEWIDDLRLGGYVIVFRHALTYSDQASTDSMSRKNVPTERQLSGEGRAQARSIGEAVRKLKIPVGLVLSSMTQRALDTASLLSFGDVIASADIAESSPELPADEHNRRAQALRTLVSERPPADNNVVIVTHKPNIMDAFGESWSDVREGEASVFEPDGRGGYRLMIRIRPNEWSRLVQASD